MVTTTNKKNTMTTKRRERMGYSGMLKMGRKESYRNNQFFVNTDSVKSDVKIPYR